MNKMQSLWNGSFCLDECSISGHMLGAIERLEDANGTYQHSWIVQHRPISLCLLLRGRCASMRSVIRSFDIRLSSNSIVHFRSNDDCDDDDDHNDNEWKDDFFRLRNSWNNISQIYCTLRMVQWPLEPIGLWIDRIQPEIYWRWIYGFRSHTGPPVHSQLAHSTAPKNRQIVADWIFWEHDLCIVLDFETMYA